VIRQGKSGVWHGTAVVEENGKGIPFVRLSGLARHAVFIQHAFEVEIEKAPNPDRTPPRRARTCRMLSRMAVGFRLQAAGYTPTETAIRGSRQLEEKR